MLRKLAASIFNRNMVPVSLNVKDYTVLQLLRNLAAMNLVEFTSETPSPDDLITAHLGISFTKAIR